MKNALVLHYKLFSIGILAVITLVGLGACGSSSNGNSSPPVTTLGTCPAGEVYSASYGCLAQGSCSPGLGMYNNTCVSLTTSALSTSATAGTCPSGYIYSGGICTVTTATSAASSCSGYCGVGSVQTSYGCLPQYSCYACFGYNAGYCISPTGYSYYLGY